MTLPTISFFHLELTMKLTSLKDLAELIPSQIPEKAAKAVYLEDDPYQNPIYQRIIKALSSGKPRTMQEIQDFVRPVEQDPSVVEQAVFFMRNNTDIGESVESPKLYWLTKPHSQMFRGTKIIGYAPRKQKEPDILMNTAKEKGISSKDSLDLAIWKVMQDRGARSASDIAKILIEYQFDGSAVKNRVITLMKRKTWFDRIERAGHDTTYVLKKTCQMPNEARQEESEQMSVNETPESLEDLKCTVFDPATRKAAPEPVPEALASFPDATALTIGPTDTIPTLIFKVMADGNEYSVADVVTLILAARSDVKQSSIQSCFSTLKSRSRWFIERKLKQGEISNASQRVSVYKLKKDVKHPSQDETMLEYCQQLQEVTSVAVNKTQVVLSDNAKPSDVSVKQDESEAIQTTEAIQTNVEQTPVLFEGFVNLKGKRFTVAKAIEIGSFGKKFLQEANTSFMEDFKLKVSEVEFTIQELVQIAKEMGLIK